MTGDAARDRPQPVDGDGPELPEAAHRLLAALLGLDAERARSVRARAARARSRPMTGPTADLGGG